MKRVTAVAGLLSCGLIVAGCASAPIEYYTLIPSTQAEPIPQGPAAQAVTGSARIDVLLVELPEMLNRQQMVVRQGGAGVSVLDRVRWASPLSDELRAALSASLAGPPVAATAGRTGPAWRVKVEIRRMDAWPGRQVLLDADWTARLAGDGALHLACRSRVAQTAPADYAGLAAAHQQAVQQLAQDIAQAVQQKSC